jgi:signal peptidase I
MLGFNINRVTGMSMHPRLPDGSFILLRSVNSSALRPTCQFRVGDVVKFRHLRYGMIIKTIAAIDDEGRYWLRGEHPSSVSMNQIGPVLAEQILARVIFSLKAG